MIIIINSCELLGSGVPNPSAIEGKARVAVSAHPLQAFSGRGQPAPGFARARVPWEGTKGLSAEGLYRKSGCDTSG